MKRLLVAALVAIALNVVAQAAAYVTCFFEFEGPSSGLRKICYYDCLGEPAAITINSAKLCPLTIQQ